MLLGALPDAGLLSLVWLIGLYALIFGIALIALGFRVRGHGQESSPALPAAYWKGRAALAVGRFVFDSTRNTSADPAAYALQPFPLFLCSRVRGQTARKVSDAPATYPHR